MPYSYYVRSFTYNYFTNINFEACEGRGQEQAVCVGPTEPDGTTSGEAVLEAFSNVFPLLSTKDESAKDLGIILAIGFFYKLAYIAGIVMKTSSSSKIEKAWGAVFRAR